jgi:hypothetical protein
MWVLGIKPGQGVLETRVAVSPAKDDTTAIRDVLEMLKEGRLKMDDLPGDVQALVRKGALEAKNAMRNSI